MNNLEEIIKKKEAVEEQLFNLEGVTAVDVGYKYVGGERTEEVVIRVHVKQKKGEISDDQKIPEEIEGIKTDVLENDVEPLIAVAQMEEVEVLADSAKYTTIKGGISLGAERSINSTIDGGTLGCIVKDNVTGHQALLSNYHVLCRDDKWKVGEYTCQPSRLDGGRPGTDRVGAIVRGLISSKVDGAISSLTGRSAECTIVDIGAVRGSASAVLNEAVKKRGRTTLLTEGFVDSVNASVSVNYGGAIGRKILRGQIGIRKKHKNVDFSRKGDSGSVVVNKDNKVIGLLFAGGRGITYLNPIQDVLSELNVSICHRIEKLIIKDNRDTKNIAKELSDSKYRIKEISDKNFKAESKEVSKDYKEHVSEKGFLGDKVDKPITDKLDKPYDAGKLREIENRFEQPYGPHYNYPNSIEGRITQLEHLMQHLTPFIGSDLRPDLSQGALKGEEDISAAQEKMNKDIADGMG